MNWLLIIVLIIMVLSAVVGYYRGFVRTVLSMAFLILVLILSGWINPYVRRALDEHTQITETIRNSCRDMIMESLQSRAETADDGTSQEQENLLSSLGLPGDLLNGILQEEENQQQQQTELLAASAADNLADLAVNGIVFLVSFFLAWIVVRILMRIADAFTELPVIGFVNRVCGGLVGILRAFLWVWIFFLVLMIFAGTGWGRICMAAVQEDPFLQFLYDNNLVLKFVLALLH